MIEIICLDSGPLGLATQSKRNEHSLKCRQWIKSLISHRLRLIVPEIAGYEVRRELLRAKKFTSVDRLDVFCEVHEYLPITTAAMRQAATFWAQARQTGRPTASDAALDGDVILAAQVATLGVPLTQIMVATTNPRHLARFVPAKVWNEITLGDQ